MFYTLLGRLTWALIKVVLRRKYGPQYVPKPLIAGAVLIAALAALLFAQKREGGSGSS